jgi:hypothetical protein
LKGLKHCEEESKKPHFFLTFKKGDNMTKAVGLWLVGVPIVGIIVLKVLGII